MCCTDAGKESTYITRGNDLRLQKSHVKYDASGFTNRVVNTRNSLPNLVVPANTTNDMFKSRLDKLWQNQKLILQHSCTELEVVV